MKPQNYKRNLKIIVWSHTLWYLFFFFAFPAILIVPGLKIYVLVFIGITLTTWLIWGACPCRIWENNLRKKYEPQTVYTGNFTSHYLKQVFGISISVWMVRIILWSLIGLLIYLSLR